MTIVPFPPKPTANERYRTPADALTRVLDAIHSGETVPQGMVIAWNEAEDDGKYKLRYLVGGDVTLAGAVGMIEITKAALIGE